MENASGSRTYCEECKFCMIPNTGKTFARCCAPKAPENAAPERFVARELDRPTYAATMRGDAGLCGPHAAWFEPKVEAEAA